MKLDGAIDFTATNDIRKLGVVGGYFVMDFDPTKADPEGTATLLANVASIVRASNEAFVNDPVLAGFRELHSKVGVSNRKHISSPENLITLIHEGHTLRSINPIVDVYNAVSLQSNLALGAHDISKIVGPISLRRANGTEHFVPLGSAVTKAISIGEYAYIDEGTNDVICRLETRQCDRTKIDASSTGCFFIVQGNTQTSITYIKQSVADLQELLIKHCGGRPTSQTYWLE